MGGHHRLLGARDPRRGCPLPNRRLWRRGAARDHRHVHILRQLPVLRRGLGCGGTRLQAAAPFTAVMLSRRAAAVSVEWGGGATRHPHIAFAYFAWERRTARSRENFPPLCSVRVFI